MCPKEKGPAPSKANALTSHAISRGSSILALCRRDVSSEEPAPALLNGYAVVCQALGGGLGIGHHAYWSCLDIRRLRPGGDGQALSRAGVHWNWVYSATVHVFPLASCACLNYCQGRPRGGETLCAALTSRSTTDAGSVTAGAPRGQLDGCRVGSTLLERTGTVRVTVGLLLVGEPVARRLWLIIDRPFGGGEA